MKKIGHKLKLFIILGVEFLAIATILLLVFFAGHKSYTVTFDLDGGTLLGGNTVQEVNRGKNASPPSVKKEGCYLLGWSRSYTAVTGDITVRAIWEYETSYGVEYEVKEDTNYCEIVGCFSDVQGANRPQPRAQYVLARLHPPQRPSCQAPYVGFSTPF